MSRSLKRTGRGTNGTGLAGSDTYSSKSPSPAAGAWNASLPPARSSPGYAATGPSPGSCGCCRCRALPSPGRRGWRPTCLPGPTGPAATWWVPSTASWPSPRPAPGLARRRHRPGARPASSTRSAGPRR
ncbi:hypothetical protein G6F57_019311 [Rhizopus arrhizus]|nr:hypothetical protein G6F57_019311 [Rhizopus arrhizus]